MKRVVALVALLAVLCFAGCSRGRPPERTPAQSAGISVTIREAVRPVSGPDLIKVLASLERQAGILAEAEKDLPPELARPSVTLAKIRSRTETLYALEVAESVTKGEVTERDIANEIRMQMIRKDIGDLFEKYMGELSAVISYMESRRKGPKTSL